MSLLSRAILTLLLTQFWGDGMCDGVTEGTSTGPPTDLISSESDEEELETTTSIVARETSEIIEDQENKDETQLESIEKIFSGNLSRKQEGEMEVISSINERDPKALPSFKKVLGTELDQATITNTEEIVTKIPLTGTDDKSVTNFEMLEQLGSTNFPENVTTITAIPESQKDESKFHKSNTSLTTRKKKLLSEKLTRIEQAALDQFRPLVEDILTKEYQYADSYLIRWLRAKKLNIQDATQMLQKAQKWRKDNRIDDILKERNFLLESGFFEFLNTFDKDGVAIYQYSFSKVDQRRLLLEGKKDQILRDYIHMLEKGVQATWENSKRSGKDSSQVVVLGDSQGFNQRQHICLQCIPFSQEWSNIIENYYPGVVKLIVLVNTPRTYNFLFQRLIPLASEHTKKVSKTFGVDRKEWSSFLLQTIPADQRTFQFGGTKKM